jgi:hypothetical protein
MTVELYHASLNPSGPNYATWREIFDADRVPLKSAQPVKAELQGEGHDKEVYLLDLAAMTIPQRARLLDKVAKKFGVPIYEVEAEIAKKGFPIRSADVIVSFDVRAFV